VIFSEKKLCVIVLFGRFQIAETKCFFLLVINRVNSSFKKYFFLQLQEHINSIIIDKFVILFNCKKKNGATLNDQLIVQLLIKQILSTIIFNEQKKTKNNEN